jgi:DNA-binding transcriptional LysR family regulator
VNFRTLDLNLLRVFDIVMVERHVTRAAERLAMTQPAVSNALRRLRDAIGADLFVPGPAGVTPTRHAEAIWPTVRSALASLRTTIEPQPFDARSHTRRFTVAMADATAAVLMPPAIDTWTTLQAQSSLHVVGLDSRDPRPLLEQGEADAAIGFFPDVERELAAQAGEGATRQALLYECEYVCVMRSGHALAARPALTLADYCAAQHLRVSFAGRLRGFVDEALERLGCSRRIVLTVENFSTAASVVHRSDLVTVLPRSFVPATGLLDTLAVRPVPFELPPIRVSLLWHRRHDADAGQQWLRALLAEAAEQVSRAAPALPGASGSQPEGNPGPASPTR